MKRKYITFLFSTLLVFVFNSCDPGVNSVRAIKNKSSKKLELLFFNKGAANAYNNIIIQPNEEFKMSEGVGLGGGIDMCSAPTDSLAIVVADNNGFKVLKDLNNSDVYVHSKKGNSFKGYHVTCRATITDADIVPK
jgi:hypothetical protein